MAFISVVPAIRTPYGVDCFDYKIADSSDLQVGDLIRVPFRGRPHAALIISRSETSDFADRALQIEASPLLNLGATTASLLRATAKRTFTSQPTVFAAWIRHVPKRLNQSVNSSKRSSQDAQTSTIFTASRIPVVIEAARTAKGRTLIITPWKHRAERIAKILAVDALHADLADGAAWNACATFASQSDTTLVTTRVGSWLCAVAETIIIDEPENDDHKQDELSPRVDARWLAEEASRLRPLCVTAVSTTPILSSWKSIDRSSVPTIELKLMTEPWQRGSKSPIAGLSSNAIAALEEALEEQKQVIILHPIHGDRSRLHCRDCGWTMKCPNCDFQMTAELHETRCHRCGHTAPLPEQCPNCGGADLSAARVGKDRVALQVQQTYGEKVRVADLAEWHRLALSKGALVIVTDVSLIGGYVEDIRRRERLVIAWRRIASAIAQAEGTLYALGPETALADARGWLDHEGVAATWDEEWKERSAFQYPPAKLRIKLIIDGSVEAGQQALETATRLLGPAWTVEGPYPVAFRAKSRKSRTVLHLLPPSDITEGSAIFSALDPLGKLGIIDLDPIAFFS